MTGYSAISSKRLPVLLVFALAIFSGDAEVSSQVADKPSANNYSPVAPATALQSALKSNLKIVSDWLNDKDYVSARETADGLDALAQLCGLQSTNPEWQTKTTAMRSACVKLAAATRKKDAVECKASLKECEQRLAELTQSSLPEKKPIHSSIKPFGSTKTWMLLMEGAYVDAKSVKNVKDLEAHAFAIAEESNLVSLLRSDPRWRKSAIEVRDAALEVVREVQGNKLDVARQALKNVYQRCEACHQGFKR